MRGFSLRTPSQIASFLGVFCLWVGFSAFVGDAYCQNKPWTSTSEWYRPIPDDLSRRMSAAILAAGIFTFEVPGDLIYPVRPPFRERAASLLAEKSLVALSNRQCRSISCPTNGDALLAKAIGKIQEKLDVNLKNPFVPERLTLPISDESKKRIVDQQQRMIGIYRAEIGRLEAWRNRLHPFLVRAVVLNESRISFSPSANGFSGRMFGDTFVVHHVCNGQDAVPMKNVPIVAFLERKPAQVYQSVSMWGFTPPFLDEATVEP
jgi:hypothetical protein